MSEPLRNWAGNVAYGATGLATPGSVEELQELVAGATRVKALGSRHSFSTVADTDGLLVSTRGLGLPVGVSAGTGLAVVPGGATFAEVAPVLHGHGVALHNLGSLPHISVAGACATGTHGSGDRLGSLATGVAAVEMVVADGSLVRVAEGDADFGGAVLSLGALGVVTRLWLRVQPTYEVAQTVWADLPLDAVAEQAVAVMASGDSVSVFADLRDPAAVTSVWVKRRTDRDHDLAPVLAERAPAPHDVHPVPGQDPAAATHQHGVPGPWHERLPHFRASFVPSVGEELQSEWFLPRAAAPDLLPALAAVADVVAPALMTFEMRTAAADDLWLSPLNGRDSVMAHFTWVPDRALVDPALAAVERVLARWDPRPHWGKVTSGPDPDAVAAACPDLPRFAALRARLDPAGAFDNAYLAAGWSAADAARSTGPEGGGSAVWGAVVRSRPVRVHSLGIRRGALVLPMVRAAPARSPPVRAILARIGPFSRLTRTTTRLLRPEGPDLALMGQQSAHRGHVRARNAGYRRQDSLGQGRAQ